MSSLSSDETVNPQLKGSETSIFQSSFTSLPLKLRVIKKKKTLLQQICDHRLSNAPRSITNTPPPTHAGLTKRWQERGRTREVSSASIQRKPKASGCTSLKAPQLPSTHLALTIPTPVQYRKHPVDPVPNTNSPRPPAEQSQADRRIPGREGDSRVHADKRIHVRPPPLSTCSPSRSCCSCHRAPRG